MKRDVQSYLNCMLAGVHSLQCCMLNENYTVNMTLAETRCTVENSTLGEKGILKNIHYQMALNSAPPCQTFEGGECKNHNY